jgi:hypothetical protein
MGSARNYKELKQLILIKEAELLSSANIIKIRIGETKNSLTSVNLIQMIFSKIVSSGDLKTEIIKTGIGFITKFIQKKIKKRRIKSKSDRKDENIQKIIDNIIEKKSDEIKDAMKLLLKTESKTQTE